MPERTRKISVLSIAGLILVLLYPALAYVSIGHVGIRLASLLLLALLIGSTALKIVTTRSLRVPLLMQVGAVSVILVAGYLLEDPLYMKLVPAFIALSAAGNFFFSLRKTPIIESIASITKPRLSADEVRYTRKVTHLWGWTMAADALLCLAAALQPDLRIWLILCFPASYTLAGLVFASEYAYRKWKFEEYDERLIWDRILKHVFGK